MKSCKFYFRIYLFKVVAIDENNQGVSVEGQSSTKKHEE